MSTDKSYLQVNFTKAGDDLIAIIKNGSEEDRAYVETWLRDARANTTAAPAVFTVAPTDGPRREMRQRGPLAEARAYVERESDFEGLVPEDDSQGEAGPNREAIEFEDDQTGGKIVRRLPRFGAMD